MSDQPPDQSSHEPSERPPLADRSGRSWTSTRSTATSTSSRLAGDAVRQGVAKAGELAHEHKGDLERLIDKAASAVDRRTDGKHADTISQVRGSLERGVEKIADQRPGDTPDEPPAPTYRRATGDVVSLKRADDDRLPAHGAARRRRASSPG